MGKQYHYKTTKGKISTAWELMQQGQNEILISQHKDNLVKRDNRLKVPTNATFSVQQDLSSEWENIDGAIFAENETLLEGLKTWKTVVKIDEDWIPFVRNEVIHRTSDGDSSVLDALLGIELQINHIVQIKDTEGSDRIKEVTFFSSVRVSKANLPDFQVKRILVIFNPNLYI